MTHEEICKLTDIPLGSVKSNIVRGSARLRETLRAYRPTMEDDRHGT